MLQSIYIHIQSKKEISDWRQQFLSLAIRSNFTIKIMINCVYKSKVMPIIMLSVSIYSLLKHQMISVQLSKWKMMLAKIVIVLFLLDVNVSYGSFDFEKNLLKTWRTNSTIYAFRGIKYAEAPIGSLRFKVSRNINHHSMIFAIIFHCI